MPRPLLLRLSLLALAVILFVVGWGLRDDSGLQTAANLAQLASVLLALPAFVTRLSVLRRGPAATHDAVEVLASAVAAQWRCEALARSLDDPDPIPVRWYTTTRDVADQPQRTGPAINARADDIGTLMKGFRALRRSRLVILGDVGTGKTMLAVQLVRELLATRRSDDPVPVLLSVAGWDTVAHPDLRSWTAAKLRQDYPALRATEFGKNAAERLVAEGCVLPVLDGLDEMRAPARTAVLKTLNRSLLREDQVVLTCRTAEYEAVVQSAGEVLSSALVIEPEPLTPEMVDNYLLRCLPRGHLPHWRSALVELPITNALDLWLTRMVYVERKIDLERLGDFTSTDHRRAHLLSSLIPAVIASRPPSPDRRDLFRPKRSWKPDDARRWLTFLAQGMADAGSPDFAWWQFARHAGVLTRWRGMTLGIAAGAIAVSAGTVFYGAVLAALATSHPNFSAIALQGLFYYLPLGIVAGAVTGATAPSWAQQAPGYADFRLGRRRPAMEAFRWWPLSLALVVFITDLLTLVGPTLALVDAVGAWLGASVVATVIALVETPTRAHGAGTPQSTLRGDRRLTLVRFWAGAVVLGMGLGFGNAENLVELFPLGGLLAVGVGRHHAWLAYHLALRRHRVLPRNLMVFLGDAHRLGLLRTVGSLYQFRHVALRDYLLSAQETHVDPVSKVTGESRWGGRRGNNST